jgi:hypothetical protein
MADPTHHTIRRAAARPRGWCCSFAGVPDSPEHRRALPASSAVGAAVPKLPPPLPPKSPLAPSSHSHHSSPSSKLAGLIDPRRILSPGRVSPIDSEGSPAVAEGPPREQTAPFVAVREHEDEEDGEREGERNALDLRLCLRGRDGRCVAMDLDSAVLCGSSAFFAGMVPDASGVGDRRVDVDGIDNLEAFKEAVELMFEPDAMRWLARAGVSRAIAVLEVRQMFPFPSVCFCRQYGQNLCQWLGR